MNFIRKIWKTLVLLWKEIVPLVNFKDTKEDIRVVISHPTRKTIEKFFWGLWVVLKEIVSGLDLKATIKKIKNVWKYNP